MRDSRVRARGEGACEGQNGDRGTGGQGDRDRGTGDREDRGTGDRSR